MARTKRKSHRKHRRQPAALRKYWASHRRTSKKKSHVGYYSKSKKAMAGYSANPRRRRRYRHNPVRHHRRRSYRRNPAPPLIPTMGFLTQAVQVAGGFYATRVAAGYVLPMVGITGNLPRIGVKAVVAWALGYVGGMVLGKNAQEALLLGGALEVMNDAVKTYVSPYVPVLAAADMQEVSAYFQPSTETMTTGDYYQPMGQASLPSDNYAE